jgi:hypothetical protein
MRITANRHNLTRLRDFGIAIWLDTLSRQLVAYGDFAGLIRDYCVTGATSNPTIFAKAMTGSRLYDDQLRGSGGGWRARRAGAVLRAGDGEQPVGAGRICDRVGARRQLAVAVLDQDVLAGEIFEWGVERPQPQLEDGWRQALDRHHPVAGLTADPDRVSHR